jgi:hypothetical protein
MNIIQCVVYPIGSATSIHVAEFFSTELSFSSSAPAIDIDRGAFGYSIVAAASAATNKKEKDSLSPLFSKLPLHFPQPRARNPSSF